MDHDDEVALLTHLFELRDAKTTTMADAIRRQSAEVYTGESTYNDEYNALFRGLPLIAGLSAELPHAGDYFTVQVGQLSVLVVRSENAGVKAFLNACRHRGSRLAEGRGAANRVFKCPYHAWVYDIDGKLLGQPLARDAFDGVDAGQTGLIELPVVEAFGLVLVSARRDAPVGDPTEHFAGLGEELAGHGFASWTPVGEREGRWAMNWKMPYETFLEAYHIFALHRDSLAKEVLATPMSSEFFGPHGRGVLTGRDAPNLQSRPQDEWEFRNHANLVYWLFPHTVLSLPMTGHAELWQFHPDGEPGRCRVHTRFYVREEPTSDKARAFWDRMIDFTMGVVESEDFAQQEAIQQNLASGLLPHRIFGRNEPALIHYHESLDAALGRSTQVAPATS